MESNASRKKSPGRPSLSPLDKQRRLVARLHENAGELERQLEEESSHLAAIDDVEKHLLLSTFLQRLTYAREAALLERDGLTEHAKVVRQKLNLFRPQGLTEEAWNALPDDAKRLAPGKPKMPKELELARIEIERDAELQKLREMEIEANEEPSDLSKLQEQHGQTAAGRPGKDILGSLDRQMHIAIYKRRDLATRQSREPHDDDQEPSLGRPKKAFLDRYNYFTSIIDHCHAQIIAGEKKLPLLDLQRRLLKRLRDKATRTRLQIKTSTGTDLVRLKLDLSVTEDQISLEADRLKTFEANYENMADMQREAKRESVLKKILELDAFDSSTDQNENIQNTTTG